MTKVPTRSPTHESIDPGRLAAMGLDLEDIVHDDAIAVPDLIELAEDRGRPPSHYVAAVALATDYKLAGSGALHLKICAGNCQQYGALDLIDGLLKKVDLVPVGCLDRCDQAPACELHGDHGVLVIAPATVASVGEALSHLSQ